MRAIIDEECKVRARTPKVSKFRKQYLSRLKKPA